MAKAVKYFVYRNINKGKDEHHYSLRSKKSGRVEKRKQHFYLKNVKFKVSDKGRQRVLSEGRKNVHAGLEGFLARNPKIDNWQRVSYNPRKDDSFRDAFKKKVSESKIVKFTPEGIYIPKA